MQKLHLLQISVESVPLSAISAKSVPLSIEICRRLLRPFCIFLQKSTKVVPFLHISAEIYRFLQKWAKP